MRLTLLRRSLHTIIMGPPGSGKGTVSSRIVRDFKLEHLSSGDMLRSEIVRKTKIRNHVFNHSQRAYGIQAEKYISSGQLVPDALVVELILSQIQRLPLTTNWLLDGFPRSIAQAKSLSERERVDAVINLDVPFATIRERLSGRWTHLPSGRVYNDGFNPPRVTGIDDVTGEALTQREDDKPETIQKRLETYEIETEPVLEFYRERNLLHSYTGTRTDDIWPDIKQFVASIVKDEQKIVNDAM